MADVAKSSRRFQLGERVELRISGIAHGGESIARLAGWVFFIRHAIPGELVIAQITEIGKSFHRADAIEIIEPSPDRITPACSYFYPGGCGGCDFHHISLSRQRALKAQVITEQFRRVAKMDISLPVEEVTTTNALGLRYRTRLTLHSSTNGELGFRKARSHEVIPIHDCLVVHEKVELPKILATKSVGSDDMSIPNESRIEKINVNGREYAFQVSSESFWQGHIKAAETLGQKVLELVEPAPGDRVLDLYGGVGLFGKLLADHGAAVEVIESSASAVNDGRINLKEYPKARYHHGDVGKKIGAITGAEIVILDPPRSGAELEVLQKIVELSPRVICYISCDPASLARDCARLRELGYAIDSASAYDLFPQTAHIECVFSFRRVIS